MNLGRLSINQPILAMVLSIVLLIVGAIAYTTLPVAEYPQVVPPTVVVTTQYPGASAQTVSDTVAAPIEQQINGVEDMLYVYSQATSNGQDKITTLGMTAADVLAAIRAQNLQITGGQFAAPPIADRAFQPNLTFTGRLKDIQQFEDILVKAGQDGRTVRLRDVARIELGALDYTTNSFLLRKTAVAMLVTQRPGSNALATAKSISDTMVKLKTDFPKGLH